MTALIFAVLFICFILAVYKKNFDTVDAELIALRNDARALHIAQRETARDVVRLGDDLNDARKKQLVFNSCVTELWKKHNAAEAAEDKEL